MTKKAALVMGTRLGCVIEMPPSEERPFLVPVGDTGVLAEAIIALARDADARQRLEPAVRQIVATRFSLDAVADSYLELYHSLLGTRT